MIVVCPKCGAKNRISDLSEPGKRYRCGKCKTRLTYIPKVPDIQGERSVIRQVVPVEMKVALLYLLGIIAAETLLSFLESPLGIMCYAIVLIALIIHSLRVTERRSRRFLLSLALVPLYKVMAFFSAGVTLVLPTDDELTFLALAYSLLLTAAVVIMRITRLGAREVGLALGKPLSQLLVGLTGIIFGLALYYMIKPQPLIPELDWGKLIIPVFIVLLAAGAEELTYRGILQRTSMEAFGQWGLLYVSMLFAVVHFERVSGMNLSIASIPFILAVALFYSWAVKKTGSLFGVTLSHVITNIILLVIAPLVL